MKVVICADVGQFPTWIGDAYESAIDHLNEHGCVIIARRADGQVQAIPEDYIDAEVMRDLLVWAAGGKL